MKDKCAFCFLRPLVSNFLPPCFKLSCYYFNARSLLNKLVELHFLLDSDSYDIIAVAETWLNDKLDDVLMINNSHFRIFRCDRLSFKQRGGGVALFVKNNIQAVLVDSKTFDFGCELLCIDFVTIFKFRFVLVYLPPSCCVRETREVLDIVEIWTLVDYPSIVVGDFNYDFSDSSGVSKNLACFDALFKNFLLASNLLCLSDFPTRGANSLDSILSNDLDLIENVVSLPNFSTSDHCSIGFEIKSVAHKPCLIGRYDFSRCDWQLANLLLFSFDWQSLLCSCESLHTMYTTFLSVISYVIKETTPVVKSRPRFRSYPKCLQNLAAKKHFLWLERHKPGGMASFQKCSRDFAKQCLKFAKNYEKRVLCSGNDKFFYSFVNRRIKTRHAIDALLNPEGDLITNEAAKADIFANFFASSFCLDDGTIADFPRRTSACLSHVCLDIKVIHRAILKLSDKLSLTPDFIPSHFLRRTVFSICLPLKIIFERSLSCSSLPSPWKTALVTPLLKKSPSNVVENYRPISLTSSVCKVFEIIVKDSLLSHLLSHHLLSDSQHGFLPGRSTLTQLLLSTHDWVSVFNSNLQTEIVFVDFAKAFDVVCHRKLLTKLKAYGVTGFLLKWIGAFLTDRSFRVLVRDRFSQPHSVPSGVPQGSVLGPLLFLVYINDLPELMQSTCKVFADDVKIYRPLRDPVSDLFILQNDLDRLFEWSRTWQLGISYDKCNVMHINFRTGSPLCIGSHVLNCDLSSHRDLGIAFEPNFQWSSHCSLLSSKALKMSYCILRSLQYSCIAHYRKAFVSYCRPILEYCPQIWSPAKISDITCIEKVQKTYTRIAFRKCFRGPFSPNYAQRLKIFGLKSLEYRRLELDLLLCYKIINALCCINFDDFFSWAPIQTRRPNNMQLSRKHCHVNAVFNFFSYRVVRVWNLLPQYIVSSPSLAAFARRLKNFDLYKIYALNF